MSSDMFYAKEINSSIFKYFYDDRFLLYFVSKQLHKNGPSSEDTIKFWIKEKTGVSNINSIQFKRFLTHFIELDKKYYIKDEYVEILSKVIKFESDFLILSWEPKEEIYKLLCPNISHRCFNISSILPYVLAIDKINTGRTQEFYSSVFFNSLLKYDYNARKLDLYICNISDGYRKLTIDFVFTDKVIVDILFANGITTVNDLVDLSIDSLLTIFACDFDHYLSIIETLNDDFESNYKTRIMEELDKLDDKEREVVFLRNGFNGNKKMTLEEIGKKYNITRERIRQIESKGMKKICSDIYLSNTIFASIYFNLIGKNEKYLTKDKLKNYVNNDILTDFILLLMQESDSYITYDGKYEVIYNKKLSSLEEISTEIIDAYGDYITTNDFEALDEFEKKVAKNNYRLVNNAIYLRKDLPQRKLVTNIIDDIFPEGYRISDNDVLEKVKEEYIKRYGYWDDELSLRLLTTYTNRENYCQIAKGTYKNRKYVPTINQYLKDKIINYILENQPAVFYESIFEHYKTELNEIGINNYYFLKGIIDPELPSEFTTKRNYIQVGETKVTAAETIISYLRTFNTVFTFNEVKEKFEGIKDYVLTNYLYSEIDNGLIWLSANKFIYINNANISEVAKEKLKKFINELFTSLSTKVMSSRKIYSRLALTNKELLNDLKIINDQFSMFSLIKYLYGNEYYCTRPLIALDKDSTCGQETLVRDYVSKLDKFNLNIIKAYQSKLSLRGLYSYLEFMEEMSDQFTQINVDTMIKKELIGADEKFVKEFGEMFSLIFSKFDSVDTRTFNGYMLLPNLEFKWNKYLLVGVVRTYFSEKYEVINTNNFYNAADFIIKKIG